MAGRLSKQLLAFLYRQDIQSCRSFHLGVVGLPFAKGQPKPGVARGPKILREYGLLKKLQDAGCLVTDYSDLSYDLPRGEQPFHQVKNPVSTGVATKQAADMVAEVIKNGQVCLSLGGDHSIAIGSILGHATALPNPLVFWIDAHADINPPLESESGNMHGMPLAFLCRELHHTVQDVPGFGYLKPCISTDDIVYIGLRDVDKAESYIINKLGIMHFTTRDVDRLGIQTIVARALEEKNPELKRHMHISFDIDSLDPAVAPSTGTPVPGGLTLREGMFIVEELANTGKLTAMDMVEINPNLGNKADQESTLDAACQIVTAAFVNRRGIQVPSGYQLQSPISQ